MKECYQPLFTPWKIGGVEIKNRIVLCPMGGTSLFGWMEPNHFDKEAAGFFLERARNHVGLIIPGIAPIRDTLGGRWLYQNKKMFRELKVFMDEIHATGAKLFVQLTAGMGRSWGISDEVMHIHKNPLLKVLAKPILDTDYQMMSPSPLPSRWAEGVTCPEITVEQIEEIVAAFAKTAALCRQAGIHTCLDTAGCGLGSYEEILKHTDLVLLDVKHYTPEGFFQVTGGSMEAFLQFVEAVRAAAVPIWVRHVVVPGLTDSPEHLEGLKAYCSTLPRVARVGLLPYHTLGAHKYKALGIPNLLDGVPPMDETVLRPWNEELNRSCIRGNRRGKEDE